MNLTITPEQINSMIAEAVLSSAIGASLKREIEKTISGYEMSKWIASAVQTEVTTQAMKLCEGELRPIIDAKVREALTPEVISAAVGKLSSRIARDW